MCSVSVAALVGVRVKVRVRVRVGVRVGIRGRGREGIGLGLGSASLDEHELLHRVGLGVGRAEEVGREHEREVAHVHLVLLRERRRLVGYTHEPAQQRALRRRELVEQPLAARVVGALGDHLVGVRARVRVMV